MKHYLIFEDDTALAKSFPFSFRDVYQHILGIIYEENHAADQHFISQLSLGDLIVRRASAAALTSYISMH